LLLKVKALREELREAGQRQGLRVLQCCGELACYAAWLTLPFGYLMPDAVFLVAMRRAYGLHVLAPTALRCKTRAGYEGKRCPLGKLKRSEHEAYGAANPHAADDHGLMCKCGGGGIHLHDGMVVTMGSVGKEWGLYTNVESKRFLPRGMRMDLEFPLAGDPGTMGLVSDLTRVHLGTEIDLRKAEAAKEEKYNSVYEAPMTMRGAAFNDFGVLGKRAMEVVDRMVAEGVRSTGSHPADLRVELLAKMSCAVMRGNAAALAYFAEVNDDREGFAPRPGALVPHGRHLAMGVTGRLTGRGRGRPRGARAPPAEPRALQRTGNNPDRVRRVVVREAEREEGDDEGSAGEAQAPKRRRAVAVASEEEGEAARGDALLS
jgi:hypothetical protein